MAPNRPTPQPSEEDTSSGSYSPSHHDEVEQQRTDNPPPLTLPQQENGCSDDDSDEEESGEEMGENAAPTKNLLLLPPPPQGREGADEVGDSKSESESDEVAESEYESDEVPLKPTLPSKENVASPDPTEKPQPKRKAPQAERAESPQPKRKAPSAESPQPKRKTRPAEVAEHGQAESNVEKLFEGKCESYWFLGKEVLALEAKQPGMFKVPFLKLADDKAHTLDTKIKKQKVAEIRVNVRRGDIEKEVTNTLINLLK